MTHLALMIVSSRTTCFRSCPSLPVRLAIQQGYVQSVVFDWGCGKGIDVRWLRQQGYDVLAYDPIFQPMPHPRKVDFTPVRTILCLYVLNVLEIPAQWYHVLREIRQVARAGTHVVVAVPSCRKMVENVRCRQWQVFSDGYLTKNQTFQRGFTLLELAAIGTELGTLVWTCERPHAVMGVWQV